MRFLIELEGPLFDVSGAWYQAHRSAANAVGWSTLDQATFWRLMRTTGPDANFLPGAKPTKAAAYTALFSKTVESDATLDAVGIQSGAAESLRAIARFGPIVGITLGENIDARRRAVQRHRIDAAFARLERLDLDPRRRPAELMALAERDSHAIVLAGTDAVLRSTDAAGLFGVGLTCGTCAETRLQRAGPRFTIGDLTQFAQELASGGRQLVRLGLLPFNPPGR